MTNPSRHVLLAAALAAAMLLPPTLDAQQGPGDSQVMVLAEEYMRDRDNGRGAGAPGDVPALAQARELTAWARTFQAKLDAVDPAELSHDAWITHALMDYQTGLAAEAEDTFWYQFAVTPYRTPLRGVAAAFAAMPVATEAQRLAYLDALHGVPRVMAGHESRLRSQMARDILLPAPELDLVVPYIGNLVADPPSSAFVVAAGRLTDLPDDDRRAFEAEVDEIVRDVVVPSIERLIAFIDGQYRDVAVDSVGVWQYPGGDDYYQGLIWQHTGLELSPQEIHDMGLVEVARLNRELEEVRVAAGFGGSLAEFREFLKTDPQFFPETSDEMADAMMAAVRKLEPTVGDFFADMPEAPYGVLRLEAELEASMTYGYYQVPSQGEPRGLYRFNGSDLDERSKLMAAALIYHELIPGHHFQIGLLGENSDLNAVRRSSRYTAHTEGWAEYASDLAGEMGMYSDPYARAGRLAMDLFLSSRLVVDTGMNALGWSRERAMTFMGENTLESDAQIHTETLRYSADMPGQALAYKLGSLTIHEMRARLEQQMGESFDLAAFHDYLLDGGSLPLGILEVHLGCFAGEVHPRGGR